MVRKAAAVTKVLDKEAPHEDGRRERSRSSRRRIIEAMMDLIAAGNINPSAAKVAEAAGVGLRSVFRHFDDKDSIYREIDEVLRAAVLPAYEAPFKSTEWKAQLYELIERRAAAYEQIAPFRIATGLNRHSSDVLMQQYRVLLDQERNYLRRILPPHVRSDAHRERAIQLAVSFDSWRLFRQDEELSNETTVAVLQQLLRDILDRIES